MLNFRPIMLNYARKFLKKLHWKGNYAKFMPERVRPIMPDIC